MHMLPGEQKLEALLAGRPGNLIQDPGSTMLQGA